MHPRRSQADRIREILKRGKGSDHLFQPLRFYRSPERRISAGLGEGKLAAMEVPEAEETPSDGMTLQ